MPQQPDLIAPLPLTIVPAPGLTEPRLWVRRLVIWRDSGSERIRDIPLRPGLNIVWSPDRTDVGTSAARSRSIGHGSGKTLFCRLLRYCLGEGRFANEAQREKVGLAFPSGMVGAEVMLNGTCWAIVRPLGMRRRHVAVANGNLDAIAAGEGGATGIEPFINAVDQSILTPELSDIVRPRAEGPTWPIALAWLTRDQECRFADVLDWRSPASNSDAPIPASGRERGPRLDALRAFLKAITSEEQQARAEATSLEERCRTLELNISHRRWAIERASTNLVTALGLGGQALPETSLLLEVMRRTARERLSAVASLPDGTSGELANVQLERDDADMDWQRLDRERVRIDTLIPMEERILSEIRGELPGLSYSTVEAESQVCPICEVPIDRAIAEKCELSHRLHDPAACRERWEKRKQDVREQTEKISLLLESKRLLQQQHAIAEQRKRWARDRLSSTEKVLKNKEDAWYAARTIQDDVEKLFELIQSQEMEINELHRLNEMLESSRSRIRVLRDRQARALGRIGEKFDSIVRRLIGDDSRSSISLSGGNIKTTINMGGDRTTAGIETLKVLAFDFACMCLSIEGSTCIPAFLVHDSPREADLGLSIYHELFRLARDAEGLADMPLFQYIITTTTPPPQDMDQTPWLRLTLRGGPANERLFRCDL